MPSLALMEFGGDVECATGFASAGWEHTKEHWRIQWHTGTREVVCAGGLGVLLVCVFDRCACDSLQAESEDDPQCDGVNQPGPSKFQ